MFSESHRIFPESRRGGVGAQIDGADLVVRVNHGPTDGHVMDVGKKTTFRVLNRKWTQMYTSKEPKVRINSITQTQTIAQNMILLCSLSQ
jgi:hypothetical protein